MFKRLITPMTLCSLALVGCMNTAQQENMNPTTDSTTTTENMPVTDVQEMVVESESMLNTPVEVATDVFSEDMPNELLALQPVSLQETIRRTLDYHQGLKILKENLTVVRDELRSAKAGWGPRVDVAGSVGYTSLSDTTTRGLGADKGFEVDDSISLTITQPLWDGFATRSRVRMGEATVDSVVSRVFDNATTFALDGIIAHADVLRQRKIVELATANVLQHEEILASQAERVALGASTTADETQTQGRLVTARATLATSESALREAENSYYRLTGTHAPKVLDELPMPAGMYTLLDEIQHEAVKNNPKIQAYKHDIAILLGEKELAESAYHPQVNLEAGPSHTNRHGPGNQWTREWGANIVMNWNLFSSGADDATVSAALGRVRESRSTLLNLMDELRMEISDTWTRYTVAQRVRDLNEQAVMFNTATRDAYLEQFILGQRSLLDVLDAENELFNSSTELETALSNVVVGAYRLEALTGNMLPNMGIAADSFTQEVDQEKRFKTIVDDRFHPHENLW